MAICQHAATVGQDLNVDRTECRALKLAVCGRNVDPSRAEKYLSFCFSMYLN